MKESSSGKSAKYRFSASDAWRQPNDLGEILNNHSANPDEVNLAKYR